MELNPLPLFIIAVFSGVAFGLVARLGGRCMGVWALYGALYGLTLSSFVVGVGHAIALPYSDSNVSQYVTTSSIISLLLIGISAGICFLVLRRLGPGKPAPEAAKPTP